MAAKEEGSGGAAGWEGGRGGTGGDLFSSRINVRARVTLFLGRL